MGNCVSRESGNSSGDPNGSVVTSIENSRVGNANGYANGYEEKKSDESEAVTASLLNNQGGTNKYPTMSDLWSHDPRPRTTFKQSKTYAQRSALTDNPPNYNFINQLVNFMVGGTIGDGTTTPTIGLSKLWIGEGTDTSSGASSPSPPNPQGILRPPNGFSPPITFQRNLIFQTLDTTKSTIINPKRTRDASPPDQLYPAAASIPQIQYLTGVSTRYSSRIVDTTNNTLSDHVVDDAVGYWLFDVTGFRDSSSGVSTTDVPVYLSLANFHGLSTLYAGTISVTNTSGTYPTLTATLSAGSNVPSSNSVLPVSGIAYTNHLAPFNNLAQYGPNGEKSNSWQITAVFDLSSGTFNYTRIKSAHPATIQFKALSEVGVTVGPFGNGTGTHFSITPSKEGDYISEINVVGYPFLGKDYFIVSAFKVVYALSGTKTTKGASVYEQKFDPTTNFVCNEGFTSIAVRSGTLLDAFSIVSADGRISQHYGGYGGSNLRNGPIYGDNQYLKNNLRLVSITGDIVDGKVVTNVNFIFKPIYAFRN